MKRSRRLLALSGVLTSAATAVGVAVSAPAVAADTRDPVIIIPGMTGTTQFMEPMRTNFVSAGWPSSRVFTWTDSTSMTGDLTKAGQEIGQKVDSVLSQTGSRKVVLVTWSASTLAARSYLKHVPGAQDKVSQYFSMAGPHHGTTSAVAWCQNLYPSCKQFAMGSPWLADLNSGTEVPGSPAVRYMTLRSTCDTNVDPSITAELAGADNRQAPSCITHGQFPSDADVFDVIKNAILAGGGTTTATTTPTSGQPPYTEKATGTAVDHYVAKRVDANQYVTLGSRHGYTTSFPLYSCADGWTDKADCTAI